MSASRTFKFSRWSEMVFHVVVLHSSRTEWIACRRSGTSGRREPNDRDAVAQAKRYSGHHAPYSESSAAILFLRRRKVRPVCSWRVVSLSDNSPRTLKLTNINSRPKQWWERSTDQHFSYLVLARFSRHSRKPPLGCSNVHVP